MSYSVQQYLVNGFSLVDSKDGALARAGEGLRASVSHRAKG
jgi:hypothetical protein